MAAKKQSVYDNNGVRFVKNGPHYFMEVKSSEGETLQVAAAKDEEPIFTLPPYKVEEQVFITMSQTMDWGISLVGIPHLWRISRGKGVKVAILDTGWDYKHPDLLGAVTVAEDFSNSRSKEFDVQGHGTHCCGIVGARDNGIGVIGAAPDCEIMMFKVLGDDGTGSPGNIARAVRRAVNLGADIISMSLGSPVPDQQTYNELNRAALAGCWIFAAAGNEGPSLDTVSYPARYPFVIAVGAIDQSKKIAKFSSRGQEVDIVAPGVGILSTYTGKRYAKLSGTSMACPQVAGSMALYRSYLKSKKLSLPKMDEIHKVLQSTAIDLETTGFDKDTGYGLYDPQKLFGVTRVASQTVITITAEDLTEAGLKKLLTFLPGGRHEGEVVVDNLVARLELELPKGRKPVRKSHTWCT